MFPPFPLLDTPHSDYIGIITLPTHQEERHREQKRKHRTVHRQPSIMPPFPPCCGLIIVASRQPVPLQGIWVDVQVKGFVADVSATLKYKNKEEKAVEAVFVFPMDEDSAVYSFEATIEGKKIVADLQEKKEAHKTYDEAISRGEQAFLLEEDESSADIFSCSVGNLPPGQEAEVTLKYVRELPVEADGAVRFVLPAILNPRYTPKDHDVSITATRPQVPIGEIPYTLSLNAHFQSTYGIAKIESKCNITPLEYTDSDKTSAKVSLAEGHKFDRDVELLAYYTDVNKPSVTVEAGLGATDAAQESGPRPSGSIMAESMAMLNFYPSFPAGQEQSNCGEFIFLVDRSGSMECAMNSEPNAPQRIHSARETLVLLLKSLPLGCYFNIYGFGSRFEAFFLESVEYTQQTMEEAVKKVNEMDASFGGTEILQPLKKIYQTAGRAEHPRQLFVFTDGEVGNTKQVIDEVQKNAQKHRCFTFGIGEGASTSLIKGMARAGSGTFEFITGKDRMQPKVLRALKCSLQPTVKDVSLTWTLPSGVEATVLSKVPTAIFQGQRSIVYAQLKGKVENEADGEVCLQYKFKDEMIKNDLRFPLKVQNAERPTIHRLASKALISELEQGTESQSEDVKKKILETSLQSGVVSSLTAYVAVNKDTKTRVEGPPVRRDVPAPALMMMRSGFHGGPRVMACSAPMPMSKKKGGVSLSFGGPPAMFRSATEDRAMRAPAQRPPPPPPPPAPAVPETPALFRLISLQNADGSWNLTPQISAVLGISETDIKTGNPDQNVEVSVWVTVLAVIWLHTTCVDQREEWELLEGKAVSWIRAKAGSSLGEFVRAGKKLLKSSVDPKVFGL
ncbi:von Willebrand factor A domain-containing protein 5A-like isoform X1 [Lithobates pipiens]